MSRIKCLLQTNRQSLYYSLLGQASLRARPNTCWPWQSLGLLVPIFLCHRAVVPAPPTQIDVVFHGPEKEFKISWSMPDTLGGVRNYLTEIAGSDCGTCNNSSLQPEVLCFDWIPNGQMCNVTVKTVSADCGFVSTVSTAKQIYLKCKHFVHAYSMWLHNVASQILMHLL